MIAHISTTTSFERTARYLAVGNSTPAPDRVLWVEPYGGASPDLMTAASEMEDLSRYNGNVEVPGYHLILSFDPEDDVGKQEMLYVRDQIHDALGFPDLMSTVVAHGDAYYPHWHELVCRVDYWTGKTVDPSFPYYKIEMRLREVERELGLRETPGRHGRLPDQTFQRKYDWTWLSTEDKRYVRAALRESVSWHDLEERLANRNLSLRLDRSNLTIVRGSHRVRAGTLHRGSSLRKMEERMGQTFADYARSQRGEARGSSQSDRTEPAGRHGTVPGRTPDRSRPYRSREGETTTQTDGDLNHAVGDKGAAGTAEPAMEGRGAAPPGVLTVLDPLRTLTHIEAENRAAAQAVGEASRRELWDNHLHDLTARTVDARVALEALFAQVYRDAKHASARYQALSADHGDGAATKRLQHQPGWFGMPTPLGRSAEGELVLQEAAARGTDYMDLLRSAQEIGEHLAAEGLIDHSWSEKRPLAAMKGEDRSPETTRRIAEKLGVERAEEVLQTEQWDGRDDVLWESPELPEVLTRFLSHQRSAPTRERIRELRGAARDMEAEILRRIEPLSPPHMRQLKEAIQRDPRLRSSERVARLMRLGKSHTRQGVTR